MELKNAFRVVLLNQQEYVINSEEDTSEEFLENMQYQYADSFFPLKMNAEKETEPEPIWVNIDSIFSVQKVKKGGLSPNSRTYSVTT